MRFTFKYRVYPTRPQVEFLDGELRDAASLYNAALEERIGEDVMDRAEKVDICVIGNLPPPINGQSLVTERMIRRAKS